MKAEPKHLHNLSHFLSDFLSALQVGPRLSFSTAWAANAKSICESCSLDKVQRIEVSRRYLLKSSGSLSPEDLAAFQAMVGPPNLYCWAFCFSKRAEADQQTRFLLLKSARKDLSFFVKATCDRKSELLGHVLFSPKKLYAALLSSPIANSHANLLVPADRLHLLGCIAFLPSACHSLQQDIQGAWSPASVCRKRRTFSQNFSLVSEFAFQVFQRVLAAGA